MASSTTSFLMVTLLLAAVTSALAKLQSGYNQTQVIYLSSDSEVLAERIGSGRSAIISLTFNATSICYALGNVTAPPGIPLSIQSVAIYNGKSGAAGPRLVTLGDSTGTSSLRSFAACASADPSNITAILANSSNYYVNVLASGYSAFRGQLGSTYQVALSDKAVDGHPSDTAGSGGITLTVGDTYVCYANFTYQGSVGNATRGDLIQRVPGWSFYSQGKVIANLFTGNPPATNCTGNLSQITLQQVKNSPADYFGYFNIPVMTHGSSDSGGALADPANFTDRLTLLATSASVSPALVANRTAVGGTGNLTVTLDITPSSICYTITNISAGIAPPTEAYIRSGGPTQAGPEWVTLFIGGFKSAGCTGEEGTWPLALDIAREPGSYYFDANNADYPDGVVRAQLGPSLTVNLLGSQEVPAANVNRANGSLILTIGFSSVCYSNLTFSGPIRNLTQGHIHNGTAGASGDVVVPLFSGVPFPSACVAAPNATLAKILADPTHYYVNIHSTTFPAGVARQQLAVNETVLNAFY